MDFLDPKKRKSHQRRLFIGYVLMAVLIGMVSILLLLQAYGYTYNLRTGSISQNGLMFIDSHPVPATLYLNGKLKGVTDQRLVLQEGKYAISLQQTGYHNWEKTIDLKGGVIERFLYPFLFPAEIESSDIELYATQPSFVTQSPDRVWLVAHVPGTIHQFEVLNLTDETPSPVRFTLPDGVLTEDGDQHSFELVEWSTDNRHFVVLHRYAGGNEYILIDRDQPSESQNISKTLTVPFSSLRLRDKKFDSYYLHTVDKTLQRVDLDQTGPPRTVATHVLSYHSHGDDELLYVTNNGKSTSDTVELRMIDNGVTYVIRDLMKSESYLLEVAQYEGDWYLVAAPSSEGKVYIFQNPVEALRANKDAKVIPAAVLRIDNPLDVSFSQNARIIAAQSGSKLATYDAEASRTYHFDLKLEPAKGTKFVWMDGHRLTAIVNGTQHVFDFDGSNARSLGAGYPNTQPYFDRDYTAAFTIAPSIEVEGRAALQRTELIVEVENN